jgi:hypothetical protein
MQINLYFAAVCFISALEIQVIMTTTGGSYSFNGFLYFFASEWDVFLGCVVGQRQGKDYRDGIF